MGLGAKITVLEWFMVILSRLREVLMFLNTFITYLPSRKTVGAISRNIRTSLERT